MSNFAKIAVGVMLGLLVGFVGLNLLVKQQMRESVEAAPAILKEQFSSEHLSSDELALVIDRGYRTRSWNVLADFFQTNPSYDRAIEVLGPPDEELRNGALAKLYGQEHLGEGAANVQILYKVGRFDLSDGRPADTFSVIQIFFRGSEFATWAGATLYLNDPVATSGDTRAESSRNKH